MRRTAHRVLRGAPQPSGMNTRTYGIGLYAPAGFVVEPEAIARAIGRLEAAGHRVVVDPTVTTRWQRFSAPDTERLAAVTRMAEDPRVELAIAVRGGYGWSRLLDRLDFASLAALATRRMVTFAGPLAAYDFGAETPSPFTLDHCWGLLSSTEYAVELELA